MFKNKKTYAIALLCCLTLFGLARLYYTLTDDFRIANMTHEIAYHQEWEIPPLSVDEENELHTILSQKFYYLGKGSQSYVFSSEDDKYVIKFFKFKHLKPSLFLNMLPPVFPFANYKKKQTSRKERKLNGVFQGYHLAYSIHKEEAGLIFIHLNKTDHLNKVVTLIDKVGMTHEIPLKDHVFVLQKKGKTLRAVLTECFKQKNLGVAKVRIRQIIDLYVSEYQKGAYDHDHGVMQNTGFIDSTPIHLDIGKFAPEEKMKTAEIYRKDLDIVYDKITLWMQKNFPEYTEELIQDMHEKYVEVTKS